MLLQVMHRAQSEALVRLWNRRPGFVIDPTARLIGRPIIKAGHADSRLVVGAGSRLVSSSFRTALGVNHPVVLALLAPGAELLLGSNVGISGGSLCAARRVEIGDGTMLGANVTICDTDFHPLDHHERWNQPLPQPRPEDAVTVGRNVFVGTGAIILRGSSLGDHSVVGAGAVVKGTFPAGSVIAGNPARVVRQLSLQGPHLAI